MKRPVLRGRYACQAIAVLFAAALFWCCRQDDHPDHQEALTPQFDEASAFRQTFAYAGRDSLILSTLDRLKELPESPKQASYLASFGARPLWDKAVHIGETNRTERLFVPVAIRGEAEINWVWIIYADHGKALYSEYLQRGQASEEHAWMFDLFTQEALGKRPSSGVTFRAKDEARDFYQTIGGKIYRCYRVVVGVDPWSSDLNMDPGKHIEGRGPWARFDRGLKCFYVADAPLVNDGDPGAPPGNAGYRRGGGGGGGGYGGYGGGGYGSGYGNGRCIHPIPLDPPPMPPIQDSVQGPPERPPGPLALEYKRRIQDPEMYKRIIALYNYTKSKEALGGVERGFFQTFDGKFVEKQGLEDAADNSLPGLGSVHTHIAIYKKTAKDENPLYSSQCFSYKDLQQFVFRVGHSVPQLPWVGTSRKPYKDLRSIFKGVVTPRGLYILTADRRVRPMEYDGFITQVNNYYSAHEDDFSAERMIDKSHRLQKRLVGDLVEGRKNLEQCAEAEELAMLAYIREELQGFGYNIRLLFFDLDSPNLNAFEIMEKEIEQEAKVKYITKHRWLCK